MQAALEANGGLGRSLGEDFLDPFESGEELGEGGRLLGGDEKVQVVHSFLSAAIGARNFGAAHSGVPAQEVEDAFGVGGDRGKKEAP